MPLPYTPDFEPWPIRHLPVAAAIHGDAIAVAWDDGLSTEHFPRLLRENSPDPGTIHPLSREMLVSPAAIPADLRALAVRVAAEGVLEIDWSDRNEPSRYHPGWLRGTAWTGTPRPDPVPAPETWDAGAMPEAPAFDGARALDDNAAFLAWLEALARHGVASLTGLPERDGLLLEIAERIGVVRASNFGKVFTLAIKDDPDSNAYTSHGLPPHTDLASRECPPGLQFLHCRANTTTGGLGTYVDGYRLAEDIRRDDKLLWDALTTVPWTFANRSREHDHRATGPVIALDGAGAVTEIRYTVWLRAPLCAPLEDQRRAYNAVRAFAERAEDPRYLLEVRYRAGDLFAFDNRRVLHGRTGYDAKGGERFIEGVYSDRDELRSRIRVLRRSVGD
ncbi:TauD/TfdA family dioxygenase [Jannaschia sp. W003]|uniref:TauD/TfdA family dioxygenase n=1 Tax=Jannaschia sp. W003 TaxID=2867012 RepID=UPI0021A6F637|nr:TauD/TfdA family dioxygenase [Jannaschia sp. W003]UWQ22943.1 TauD/TfdA family dioxygenase [Jannaschia sp. W003]